MKKIIVFSLIICVIFSVTGCKYDNTTEKYNIGEIPPKVLNVSKPFEKGYFIPMEVTPWASFAEFEESFKASATDNGVIIECEMAEAGTLVKSFPDNNQGGFGNYNSFVITPIKVLKVHYQGEAVEKKLKVGDIVNLQEPYYWVTSDMEEVREDYEVGTYLTHTDYYPMMLGKRYVLYANSLYLDDYGVEDNVLYPYNGSSAYCISEDVLHYERQCTYSWYDCLYQIGAWLKYSDKKNLDYAYADVFTEIEDKYFKIIHEDKSSPQVFDSLEEMKESFINQSEGKGVILSCTVKDSGQQVKNIDNQDFKDYEYFTMSSVEIDNIFYRGDNVSESIRSGEEIRVCEPYYMSTNEPDTYITHSRYSPIKGNEKCFLFAYVSEYEGETVLVPQSSAVSQYDVSIPEHRQITLGPEGLLCYLEIYAAYGFFGGDNPEIWY